MSLIVCVCFRPFAPSVLREDVSKWFSLDTESSYMLIVADINSDKKIEMTNREKKLLELTN
mgnify:CR=1 FL=1